MTEKAERYQQHLAVVERYRRQFPRFAEEQLKVRPKEGGAAVPMKLNTVQRLLEDTAQAQLRDTGLVRIVTLKGRQQGGTTWTAARGFQRAVLNANSHYCMVAHDKKTVEEAMFPMTRLFYDSMSRDIRPMVNYQSKKLWTFENPDAKTRPDRPGLQSQITVDTARNIHSGTGKTIHFLHLSESSKYGNPEFCSQLASALFQSVPSAPGTAIVIESTAFVTGDWFKGMTDRAARGNDLYKFVFLPWVLQEEYRLPLQPEEKIVNLSSDEKYLVKKFKLEPEQLKWRRMKIEELVSESIGRDIAEQLFQMEYPHDPESAWISLDLSAFDQAKLIEMKRMLRAPMRVADVFPGPRVLDNPRGALSIWEEPVRGELYDLGVDVATGTEGGDWSVGEVIHRKTKAQVAEFRTHLGPLDLAEAMYWLGLYYNTAQVGVEVDGIGFATNDAMNKMNYPNLYIWRTRGEVVPRLTKHSGWQTSNTSKKLMVSTARHRIGRGEAPIRSVVLHNELQRFAVIPLPSGGETYAASTGNDDACLAWMISLMISEDEEFGHMAEGPAPSPKSARPDPATYAGDPLGEDEANESRLEMLAREMASRD